MKRVRIHNPDGTFEDVTVAEGPTVHLRMPSDTDSRWLARLAYLLSLNGAKIVRGSTGAIIAVEVPPP